MHYADKIFLFELKLKVIVDWINICFYKHGILCGNTGLGYGKHRVFPICDINISIPTI